LASPPAWDRHRATASPLFEKTSTEHIGSIQASAVIVGLVTLGRRSFVFKAPAAEVAFSAGWRG